MTLQSIGIDIIDILSPIACVFLLMLFLAEAISKGLVKIVGTFAGLCLLPETLVPRMGMVSFTLFSPLILVLCYRPVTRKDLVISLTLSSGLFVMSIPMVLETTGILVFIQKDDLP